MLCHLSLYFIGLDGIFLFAEYFIVMRCFLMVLVLVLVLGNVVISAKLRCLMNDRM